MNIKFEKDIIIVDDALSEELIAKLLQYVIEKDSLDCTSLHTNVALLEEAKEYWYSNLEKVYMNVWLDLNPDGTSSLYKFNKEQLAEIQRFTRTVWRDLYVLNYHKDNSKDLINQVHADFSNFTFSCALNDEYEGGELVFPRQDFSIRLKKNQMAIFPGGLTHPHYTVVVTSGNRFQFIGQAAPQAQDHELDRD